MNHPHLKAYLHNNGGNTFTWAETSMNSTLHEVNTQFFRCGFIMYFEYHLRPGEVWVNMYKLPNHRLPEYHEGNRGGMCTPQAVMNNPGVPGIKVSKATRTILSKLKWQNIPSAILLTPSFFLSNCK